MTDIYRDIPAETWHQGFEISDSSDPLIETVVQGGPQKVALILDWDGVLATKDHDGIGGTTWDIMKRNMTPENQQRHSELFTQYRDLERDGILSVPQAMRWQTQALKLLTGTSLEQIEQDAHDHVTLRDGVKELFAICEDNDIPTFIKSAGAAAIIRAVTVKHCIKPTRIDSNEFRVVNGYIAGIHPESLTHSLNKHAHSHQEDPAGASRPTAILVGDNFHDVHMVSRRQQELGGSSLRIRLDGGKATHVARHGESAWNKYVKDSFEGGYDLVAIEDNTIALNGLLKAVAAGKPTATN